MTLSKKTALELLGLVIITLGLYWPSFQFDFVNYDDQVYILNNTFIHQPSLMNLLDGSETGNFHPVTMLTLLADFWLGEGSSSIFHIGSTIWHMLNVMLVFFLVKRVIPNRVGIPFFVAMLFAIHPMHIESVAWVSSRKDVVYTFFYLCSLITYFDYLKTKAKKYLVVTIVTATISLLAKPAATTLPIALILLQYFVTGTLHVKRIFPLIPLFIGSVAIGLITIQLQNDAAINDLEIYSLFERAAFAFYGIFFYTSKSLLPMGLAPMHPYPLEYEMLSWQFLISVLIGASLVILGMIAIKKRKRYGFAVAFFFLNLILTLQLVSIGRAIVSERYTYLCYLGLFLVVAFLLDEVPTIRKVRTAFYGLSLIIGIPFFYASSQQIKVWRNSETLWNKAIQENPQDWFGYIGRGNYYKDLGSFSKALADFTKAIELDPTRFDNYFNLGDLQRQLGNIQEAIQIYSMSIKLKPDYAQAYVNRGQFYVEVNDGENALTDFNQALALDSNSILAYNNRGSLYVLTGHTSLAVADFSKATELDPSYAKSWFNRGTALLNSNPSNAKRDLEQAILLDPNYFDAYNNLGSLYFQTNDFKRAAEAFSQALRVNPKAASVWLNLSIVKNSLGDYAGALESALKAKNQGTQVGDFYLNQLRSKLN